MFLKQTSFKPRSGSLSSSDSMSSNNDNSGAGRGTSSSHNSQPGAVKGGASSTPTGANSDRRRSSTSNPFSGLNSQKRTGDADSDAKKASFMEQKPGSGGPLSNLWNNFTKGPTGAG